MPWGEKSEPSASQSSGGWLERRKEKMREEIERNRRGEYTVPTWVLVLVLVVIVGAFVGLMLYV